MTESLVTVMALAVSGGLTAVILTRAAVDVLRHPTVVSDLHRKT
ncbi:MAG: hypothetical protein ACRC14_01585 [Paracoccaceae bacterium]